MFMRNTCNWCGEQMGEPEQTVRLDWARKVNICKKCSKAKDEHRCTRCKSIKPNQIFINGVCEDCSSELLAYREKEFNNSLVQLNDDIDWQIDNKEKVWRSKLFSTSRVQMNDTELQQQGFDVKQIVNTLIKEQQSVDFQCRQGFAMRAYGISLESQERIIEFKDELIDFLERYSKKLLIEDKVNHTIYTLVFLDEAMDTMQLDCRTQLVGEGSHFFLLPIRHNQIDISAANQQIIKRSLQRYIESFNRKNS